MPLRRDQLGERFAVHVFHHQEVDPALAADVVECDDVGLIQRRSRAGLVNKPRLASRIARQLARQDFQGDAAAQARVLAK